MEAEFWVQKWQANQIGFHGDAPHPQLIQHWDALRLARAARVFVPLCGKSLDLLWLRQRGHGIVGVELSQIAVEAFFDEHQIKPQRETCGPFERYRAEGFEILCGDYFALSSEFVGHFDAIYDRAALIALPPTMRERYAAVLTALAPPRTQMLLITVQYSTDRISPPPFNVEDAEIVTYYRKDWDVVRIGDAPAMVKDQPGTETVFKLVRR
jgi:thiopurine S-methyltransferase